MRKRIMIGWMTGLVILLLLAACQGESEEKGQSDSTEDTAESFVDQLAEENYDDAYEQLDATMESEIGVSDLEALWTDLNQQFGDHIEFEFQNTETGSDEGYDIVFIDSHHEKEDITFRVTVSDDLEIAGFFIE